MLFDHIMNLICQTCTRGKCAICDVILYYLLDDPKDERVEICEAKNQT